MCRISHPQTKPFLHMHMPGVCACAYVTSVNQAESMSVMKLTYVQKCMQLQIIIANIAEFFHYCRYRKSVLQILQISQILKTLLQISQILTYMTEEVQTGRNPIANVADVANIADIANITDNADIANPIANIADINLHERFLPV